MRFPNLSTTTSGQSFPVHGAFAWVIIVSSVLGGVTTIWRYIKKGAPAVRSTITFGEDIGDLREILPKLKEFVEILPDLKAIAAAKDQLVELPSRVTALETALKGIQHDLSELLARKELP